MDAGKQIPQAVDLSNGYSWVFEILVALFPWFSPTKKAYLAGSLISPCWGGRAVDAELHLFACGTLPGRGVPLPHVY